MKKCPYCEDMLEVIDIDVEGFDVLGCATCDWDETSKSNDEEMEWYL